MYKFWSLTLSLVHLVAEGFLIWLLIQLLKTL